MPPHPMSGKKFKERLRPKNRSVVFVWGFIFLLLMLVLVNRRIFRSLDLGEISASLTAPEATISSSDYRPPGPLEAFTSKLQFWEFTPADFETLNPQLLRDEDDWDLQMEKMLGNPRVLEQIEDKGTFQGTQQSPQEYARKMRWLDLRIKETEAHARRAPRDDDARQRLQDLYMLRSSMKSLEDVVTTQDSQ